MSSPYEFAEKFGISLKKVRAMIKANDWPREQESPEIDAIRHLLNKGQPLPAAHLCRLIEEPSLVLDLGRYAGKAQEQIDALGHAREEAAPKHVSAYIADAARGDQEAIGILVEWLKGIIPAQGVEHPYIAVRLLLGLAPNVRAFDVPRLPRALLECRKREDFAPYWRLVQNGTRNRTIYARPAKKPVANFDL